RRQRIAEAVMVDELPGRRRRAVLPDIGRRRADRHSAWAETARHQPRIWENPDPDRQVPPFLDEIDDAVIEPELDRHMRIAGRKPFHERWALAGAERPGQAHPHFAARLGLAGACRLLRLDNLAQYALAGFEIAASRLGQGEAPRRPMEEADAEPRLDRLD